MDGNVEDRDGGEDSEKGILSQGEGERDWEHDATSSTGCRPVQVRGASFGLLLLLQRALPSSTTTTTTDLQCIQQQEQSSFKLYPQQSYRCHNHSHKQNRNGNDNRDRNRAVTVKSCNRNP